MNMIQMVSIMTLCYFVAFVVICLHHNHINTKVGNIIFISISVIFFFGWNYAAYEIGWLEGGFMTFQNISQFTLTIIPLTLLMSEKAKSYFNSTIAFLWVGMFIALGVSPEFSYIFKYKQEATLILSTEASCHLIASLYGVYLIISGQVVCDFKHWVKSLICMYSVIAFVVITNFTFHMDHFGMDPYGNYRIYFIDIFGSFWETLLAYLLGVFLVLTGGMQIGALLKKSVDKIHIEPIEKLIASTESNKESEKETQEASYASDTD